VYGKVKLLKQEEKLVGNLYGDKPLYYGTERFANDYWIGNHPQLNACDLSQTPNRAYRGCGIGSPMVQRGNWRSKSTE
jgi:hypothetical protein